MGCLQCLKKRVEIKKQHYIQRGTINPEDVPDDQCLCPNCGQNPELMSISTYNNCIEMKCKDCGIQNYSIKELFDKFKNSKYNYLNYKCNCREIKGQKNNKYEFCTLCKKVYCDICIKNHKKNHNQNLIPVNKKPFKCLEHSNSHINAFCEKCERNICDHSFEEHRQEVKNNNDYNIIKLPYLQNEINSNHKKIVENIKEKNNKLADTIRVRSTIINSYQNHKNNYNYIKSINNLARSILSGKKIKDEYSKNIFNIFERKLKDQEKYIKELQKKRIFLDGKEDKLNLRKREIDDETLNLISKIQFQKLKEINLSDNQITNIEPLYYMNLNNVEKIDLSFNKIENIEIFKELKLPKLKEICLQNNQINNFNPIIDSGISLEFERLRIEKENNDIIKDFGAFKEKLFKKYKNLDLFYKAVTMEAFKEKYGVPIDVEIDLSDKRAGNIVLEELYNIIGNLEFKEKAIKIKKLILRNNNIDDCSLLSKIHLIHLRELDLSVNKIKNLDFLANMKLPKLEKLFLDNNYINNLSPLIKVKEIRSLNDETSYLKVISLKKNNFVPKEVKYVINLFKDEIDLILCPEEKEEEEEEKEEEDNLYEENN